ncbi:hypothetical protein GCM10027610_080360 [Dactylosporangium cerinum]
MPGSAAEAPLGAVAAVGGVAGLGVGVVMWCLDSQVEPAHPSPGARADGSAQRRRVRSCFVLLGRSAKGREGG